MPTHTTPPPHADQTDQTAEPARRASRFDQRGVALQTIIIMVVLLAIAGTVAAVLLTRAGEETDRLEADDYRRWTEIESETGCEIAGGRPSEVAAANPLVLGDFDPMEAGDAFAGCYPPG